MGLLFFLAGHFAELSIAKKGPRAFLRERCGRLGFPSLCFMLVIWPLTVWGLLGYPKIQGGEQLLRLYANYVLSGKFISCNGPLWFALALLLFSSIFAAARSRASGPAAPRPAPGTGQFLLFCAGLVLATFGARLFFPPETNLLNFNFVSFRSISRVFGWAC
jgi:hypothetical protein